MLGEEEFILKQIDEVFEKIVILSKDSVNSVIKKIIDNLIELRVLHPSIEYFGDKVQQSFSLLNCKSDVRQRLARDGSSPVFENAEEANELNVVIQKEGSEDKASSCHIAKKHEITSPSFFNGLSGKMVSGVKCDQNVEHSDKTPSAGAQLDLQFDELDFLGISKPVVLRECDSGSVTNTVPKKVAVWKGNLSGRRQSGRRKKQKFHCDTCNYLTYSKLILEKHVRKHLVKTECYKCTICDKKFRISACLKIHMKRHTNQRDFPCDICEYKAFTKTEIKLHMTVHSGEKNSVCHICGKAFTKESSLRKHVRSIHERSTKEHCPQCDFTTYYASSLKAHVKLCHEGELRNCVCPVCGLNVKVRSSFIEHMRSHTGDKPFSCDECKSSFACAGRLKQHRLSVHEPRRFHCPHCPKVFQTKHHMLRHETIHTNEKPFQCPLCSYACNTQGNLTKHVRLTHHRKEFSLRKKKTDIKEEWVDEGQKVTEEYLKFLSEKLGRDITVEELRVKESEKAKCRLEKMKKAKLRHSKRTDIHEHSYFSSKQSPSVNGDCVATNETDASALPTSATTSTLLVQLPNGGFSDGTLSETNPQFPSGQLFQVLQTVDGGASLSNTQFIQVESADGFSQNHVLTHDLCSLISTGANNNGIVADQEVYQLVSGDQLHLCVNGYGRLEENSEEMGVQIHLGEKCADGNKENMNILSQDVMESMSYFNVERSKTDSENTVLVIINTDSATAES
ncbi:zinc finger protein 615-like [Bacillus rossius redtenbacheri]|uniref:zinc finger protein 615-like n=1 Tax=Bacillus rossius redtenbacheri TaxID=93214 RepID=UPI002FDD5169